MKKDEKRAEMTVIASFDEKRAEMTVIASFNRKERKRGPGPPRRGKRSRAGIWEEGGGPVYHLGTLPTLTHPGYTTSRPHHGYTAYSTATRCHPA